MLAIVASTSLAEDRGWDYQPHQIRAFLALDAPGGLSQELANNLPIYLQRRVHAAIGPLWSFQIEVATGPLRQRVFADSVTDNTSPPADWTTEGDKLLLLAIRYTSTGYALSAREYDRFVERWGMPLHVHSRQAEAIPEQLFALAWQAVSPIVQFELDPDNDQLVRLAPRGAALARQRSNAPMLQPGDVLLPVFRRLARGGEVVEGGIQVVPWTYLEVADSTNDDAPISARIHSGNRRPFGVRRQGRVEQAAIALRAEPAATTLRLHSRAALEKPLVGYTVYAQKSGSGAAVSNYSPSESVIQLGATDLAGKLSVPPGETRIRTLYLKNGEQVLARLPIVPGAEPLIDVPLPDDDPRLAAEARLAALREELIDVVARRKILMARARQKIKQNEFAVAQKLLADVDQLPGRSQFNLTLTTAARTLRSSDPQIQRRIDQLFEATLTVMNQYLDLRPINQLHDELRAARANPPSG